MSNGIVLNHHSLPFKNKDDSNNGLLDFFYIIKACRNSGLKLILVDEDQDKSLMGLELADNYFIRDWYASAKKEAKLADWCRFLRSIETKQPLFETVDLETLDERFEVGLIDEATGKPVLLAAFHFQTYLVSFTAIHNWTLPYINVWVFELGAQKEQRTEILSNLCNSNSLATHQPALIQRRNRLLNNAINIWQQREQLFPNLTFLDNQIGTALRNWSAKQNVLIKARDALNILESFSKHWSLGAYPDYRHEYLVALGLSTEVSGESTSVYNNDKKKRKRMFWLEDGREVYCENHVKLPDGYRMHFYPDNTNRHIYVAYLGPHLPL